VAITTYAELQTAIADWLDRSDLTSKIPDFITLAEYKLFRDLRLSEWEQRATADTVAGSSHIARPANSDGILSIKLNTDPVQHLTYESLQYINGRYLGSSSGKPTVYCVTGNEIRLAPTPDSVYEIEITYSKPPEALSDVNTTNWFTENAPDLLLYASLLEATPYIRDNEMTPVWYAASEKIKTYLIKNDNAIKYPKGSLLTARAN